MSADLAAVVVAKRHVSDSVATFELEAPDGSPLPPWQAGAHVDVMIAGVPTRQYSLSGDPDDVHRYRLGVLREGAGGTSDHLHDRVAVGDEVTLRGPRNNFPLHPSPRYVFVAGGIGITPILPMVRAAQRAGADWHLSYGGRGRASMAFCDELACHGNRVTVVPQDEAGLLDLHALLGTPQPQTLVYCCGPEPLLAAVEARCAGWPTGSLKVERFAARPDTSGPATAFEIVLARTGSTLTVPADRSVLEVLRANRVPMASSCEEGTCGTCETVVLEGDVDHRDSILDDDERAANDCMMVCVSRAKSSRLVLDL